MDFFTLSFTRTNEKDPQEIDIFSLRVRADSEPSCLADFSGGTADVSFGYQAMTVSYDIKAQTEQENATLELKGNPQYKLDIWLMPESKLEVGGTIGIAKNDYDRTLGKITRCSWKSTSGKK